MKQLLDRALRTGEKSRLRAYEKRVESINRIEPEMELLSDEEMLEEADSLRRRAGDGEPLEDLLPETFALVREAARRHLGQRHYDVQLLGGMILADGAIAEMKTGEGKTLTSTLPIVLWSLRGEGVHVVTVNDYLAQRDAEWMGPIYSSLGITYGAMSENDTPEERRELYGRDITYGTNSEFGFDYLRDNMARSSQERVQRGHAWALVDEVDNILIDEARTPLIISGAPEEAAGTYQTFARLARTMRGVPAEVKLRSEGQTRDTSDADYDYEYDEKHKTVSPTERGVAKAEQFLGIDHLYEAERGPLVNHLFQALKAESLYRRDRDYAVVDGQVHIVDEFTGRILEGRRWSEGLHQAIEAKEGVRVREENQTLASITLQNYFRLYGTLSGMTGTALTEAVEFSKIYDVHVLPVPTHLPVQRHDRDDLIYKTEEGKWAAIADEITTRNKKGQPVLVGTTSVEKSERLSEVLRSRGIEHVVLNAKPENAEREGEIVSEAGRWGAVTIATNMAGRGVDIKLGGDPEELARRAVNRQSPEDWDAAFKEELLSQQEACQQEGERVREAGGLFILGTERHESRRIDNQLRGRSGRQGDPGESQFLLSAEDEVLRLFAGDRIYRVIDRLGPTDKEGREIPLQSKLLSKTIEGAQKKVEEQNFLIRKRVLEYDDVLSEQRRVVYLYRDQILDGRDMSETVLEEMRGVIRRIVELYTPGDEVGDWDLVEMDSRLRQIWPVGQDISQADPYSIERDELEEELWEDFLGAYRKRSEEIGPEAMRELERIILLSVLDSRWREHLYDMDYLREGIHLRGFAQIDPLVAYKNEGFQMFEEFLESLWDEFAALVLRVEVRAEEEPLAGPAAAAETPDVAPPLPSGDIPRVGRNELCPCGSGKKYKRCHGA